MIAVSPRRLPWLLAVLAAAVPLVYANVLRTHDECGEGTLPARLVGVGGIERFERHGNSVFQWTSREAPQGTLNHAVVRSRTADAFASVSAFVRPDVVLPSRSELRLEPADGVQLPIHYSHTRGATASSFMVHLFLFRGRPVESILPHRLTSVWEQLVSGRRPATLLVAWGTGTPEEIRALEGQATHWIVETWRRFESQCGS